MDQQEVILATIGDLEISRRQLIMEVQARDQRIAELEAQIAELTGAEKKNIEIVK